MSKSDVPAIPGQDAPLALKGHVLFTILTRGIYTTFTRAIKEAVSNAYDAGASNVMITFDPPQFLATHDPAKLTIQIRDDGNGMSRKDFWSKFASIESEKDSSQKDPVTKRFPIGQFGIGSFALVPFSLKVTLFSKRDRQKPIKCVIKATELQKKTADDFQDHVRKNIVDQEISDEEWQTVFNSDDSGTVIVIDGVTKETYGELRDGTDRFADDERGLFPHAPFTPGLKEVAWELSTLLPLKYSSDPGGVAHKHSHALHSHNDGIAISLSEVDLERCIYSRPGCLTRVFEYDKDGIRASGVLVAIPSGSVQPREANGVMLRLNNVGIGSYSMFNAVGQGTIRRKVTGEIHILDGLHHALNAPRDRFSGPEYDGLKRAIEGALAKLMTQAYSHWDTKKGKKDKQEEKAEATRYKELKEKRDRAKSTGKQKATKRSGGATPNNPKSAAAAKSTHNSGSSKPADSEDFTDPVVSVRSTTGDMKVDDTHPLFKAYSRKSEARMIRTFLRALKLAHVPESTYEEVVQILVDLKDT